MVSTVLVLASIQTYSLLLADTDVDLLNSTQAAKGAKAELEYF